MVGKYISEKHRRRSIRLQGYDYSQAGAYFVTICTWNRECIFGDIESCRGNSRIALNEHGKVAEKYFGNIEEHFDNVHVEEFIIMPNHIHAIIFIDQTVGVNIRAIRELPLQRRKRRRQMLLPKIIGWLKMNASKSINRIRGTEGRSVWQKNYYEHVVRNEKDLRSIQEYIINNPLQWEMDENNPVNVK